MIAAGTFRRLAALSSTELILLRRNKVLLFNAALTPLVLVALMAVNGGNTMDLESRAQLASVLTGVMLLLVVYVNLLYAYVARRDERVLTRLRAGECRDGEILAGTAVPSVLIALGQLVVLFAVGASVLHMPVPAQPVLLVVGVLLGCLTFIGLALLTTLFTRNVEAAQVTSLPVLVLCVFGGGLAIPLDGLPAPLPDLARLLPMSPVMELVRLGWLGPVDGYRATLVPLAVGVAWALGGVLAARRWFRWDARA